MKKILAVLIIISMAMIATPSVLADDPPMDGCGWDECNSAFEYDEYFPGSTTATITTTATVGSTGGGSGGELAGPDAPIIKCKWEYDLEVEVDLADCPDCTVPGGCHDVPGLWKHDACVCIDGLQVKPDLGETTTIGFYAIVTDPQGVSTVDRVYADVWHPDGQFKYQIQLFPVDEGTEGYDNAAAIAAWEHAKNCHDDLITINDEWAINLPGTTLPIEDIDDELGENMAYLYYGEAELSYCQPGGWYTVGIVAFDNGNEKSDCLKNNFWYIPVAAVDIDFTSIDYGSILVGYRKQVGGDADDLSTTTKPTVRNIGNTPVVLSVEQDDMQFGETDGAYNVHYDARMGITGDYVYYGPDEEATLPGILALCSMDKLDFAITATKGENGFLHTGSLLLRACIDMDSYVWDTPADLVGDAPIGVEQDLSPSP